MKNEKIFFLIIREYSPNTRNVFLSAYAEWNGSHKKPNFQDPFKIFLKKIEWSHISKYLRFKMI